MSHPLFGNRNPAQAAQAARFPRLPRDLTRRKPGRALGTATLGPVMAAW